MFLSLCVGHESQHLAARGGGESASSPAVLPSFATFIMNNHHTHRSISFVCLSDVDVYETQSTIRDVQRAQCLYLYLYLLRQKNYLYLYSNKSGKRLKNPVFVFITFLILEN